MLLWVLAAAAVAGLAAMVLDGVESVAEGQIGVVFVGSAARYTVPSGLHMRVPFVTSVVAFQVKPQTYTISKVQCPTSSGINAWFDQVDVVASLHTDRLLEFVRNFSSAAYDSVLLRRPLRGLVVEQCSRLNVSALLLSHASMDEVLESQLSAQLHKLTGGALEVVDIRLGRPSLPFRVRESYAALEATRAQERVVVEQRAAALRDALAAQRYEVAAAEQTLSVANITTHRRLQQALGNKSLELSQINARAATTRSDADAEAYRRVKAADAMKPFLTKNRLAMEAGKAVATNIRMYLGNNVPRAIIEEAATRPPRSPQSRQQTRKTSPKQPKTQPATTHHTGLPESTASWEIDSDGSASHAHETVGSDASFDDEPDWDSIDSGPATSPSQIKDDTSLLAESVKTAAYVLWTVSEFAIELLA
jgi:hypothetical protein